MGPGAGSSDPMARDFVEMIPVDECVVDEHPVVAPAGSPAPIAPPEESTEADPDRDLRTPEPPRPYGRRGGIVPIRVRVVLRRSPDPVGVIDRHVDHVGVGGLDLHDGLPVVVGGDHFLLVGGRQLAGRFRFHPHPLNGVHFSRLVGQEGVSKARRPGDILVQAFQNVGENHQRLNAGVPILSLGGLGELRAL